MRRLEKRIYVDLPNEQARHQIFKVYLKPDLMEKTEYGVVLKKTNGYSCADLKLLCKEAWMMQLRPVWAYLENENLSLKDYKNDEGINELSYVIKAMTTIKPTAQSMQSRYDKWDRSFINVQEDDIVSQCKTVKSINRSRIIEWLPNNWIYST